MDKTKIFHWICCFTEKCHITKIKCDISFKIIDFQYSAILKLEKWHAVLLTRKYKSLRSVKSLSTCECKQIPEEHQCFFVLTLCLAHINNLSPASMNVSGNLTALLRNEWSMIRHDFQCRFSEEKSLKTIAWTNGACRCCTLIYNQTKLVLNSSIDSKKWNSLGRESFPKPQVLHRNDQGKQLSLSKCFKSYGRACKVIQGCFENRWLKICFGFSASWQHEWQTRNRKTLFVL